MSQQELATAAGTTDRLIRSVEKAERETFHRGTLRDIAEALGWTRGSIDRILGGGEPQDLEGRTPEWWERLEKVERMLADLMAERER